MSDAKKAQMQAKFKELDSNGDNSLDFDELKGLLQKGNPNFKDADARKLYERCDTNHDGRIDFEEFMNYIYGGAGADDSEGDWDGCNAVFMSFMKHGHQEMEGKEFGKLCKETKGLYNKKFKMTDVDLIFAKVVPKGKRTMAFEGPSANQGFQQAVREIAKKRGSSIGDTQTIIASSSGPVSHATKADYVKFNDDKSTFTGAACNNSNFEGVDANHGQGRHEKMMADTDAAVHNAGPESDWGPIEAVFTAFAGDEVDGKEFKKLCEDIHLIDKKTGFTLFDVDTVFAAVARKKKKIGFEEFKDCVRRIAGKKKKATSEVQAMIAERGKDGPVSHSTKADAVRFHDDKSTYTGAKAVTDGDGHKAEAHDAMKAAAEAERHDTSNEGPWEPVDAVFLAFGGADGLDGREFKKFLDQTGVLPDGKKVGDLNAQTMDLVFASAIGTSKVKKLDMETYKYAVRGCAKKMHKTTQQVQEMIAKCDGPTFKGTEGASRFHDDKSSYTGTHHGK